MQEKSLIKKNILQYIDLKGVSEYKFYQQTGITRGILKQKNGMSEKNTAKFLAYFTEVSPDWLITGKGNMLRVEESSDSSPIIELNPSAKANTFVSDLKAAAGFGALINNPKKIEQLPAITLPNAPMGLNIAFPITGDSMHPTVRHSDYVAGNHVRDIKDIRNGYTYILIDRDDGAVYKRLYIEGKRLRIVSDNPQYPPYTREPDVIVAYFKAFCCLSFDFRPYHDDIRRDMQQIKDDIVWLKSRVK